MTPIAPASIVTAVCSNCWSTAGNDGARQNRIAEVPSQHDCFVIELPRGMRPGFRRLHPLPCQHLRAYARQRCQPIPHSAR
jgi:hypothetical protein